MDREEFQQKLDVLIAEAQGRGMSPIEVSLILQETYEWIDENTMISLAPAARN